MRFFNITDRVPIERHRTSKKRFPAPSFKWGLIEASSCVKDDVGQRQILFRPHPIFRIKDAAMLEILELYKSFLTYKEPLHEVRKSLCPVCCETFDINSDAERHRKTREHIIRFAKLQSSDVDDMC
ncbi:uncharacterized protein LOC100902648 [Galendromus occidentalis]|uniref:Uncharacterized protein LOC100902648 n=1 Tax=Galendromus occidentalis TaxID=34638 RepID=A0AAJ6QVX4_9ACAR|nr:uncharacterized protein LOC100902648 [Galendromus occidentalis]